MHNRFRKDNPFILNENTWKRKCKIVLYNGMTDRPSKSFWNYSLFTKIKMFQERRYGLNASLFGVSLKLEIKSGPLRDSKCPPYFLFLVGHTRCYYAPEITSKVFIYRECHCLINFWKTNFVKTKDNKCLFFN